MLLVSAIHQLLTDKRGCVLSLKRLKYTFGQRSRIAQAHLAKITRGKQIRKDDDKDLLEFYYTISDCLITLHQLNYESDINSTDFVKQFEGCLVRFTEDEVNIA